MENELGRVVDALPGLVWTALPDGHIDFVNRRFCEYLGIGVDEAAGRNWQSATHKEDLPELAERWQTILASGERGGMGIGLSVSRSIIESHHGRLWAGPNDGPGATFSFSVPCGPEATSGAQNVRNT